MTTCSVSPILRSLVISRTLGHPPSLILTDLCEQIFSAGWIPLNMASSNIMKNIVVHQCRFTLLLCCYLFSRLSPSPPQSPAPFGNEKRIQREARTRRRDIWRSPSGTSAERHEPRAGGTRPAPHLLALNPRARTAAFPHIPLPLCPFPLRPSYCHGTVRFGRGEEAGPRADHS